VDNLSKRPKYIPTRSDVDAPQTAKEFFERVVRHHGLPAMIISDRDSKFTSTFWKSLMEIMDIRQAMTTAGRAKADGGTDRQNRTLEDALRCQVSYLGQDWVEHFPTIVLCPPRLSPNIYRLNTVRSRHRPQVAQPFREPFLVQENFAKNFAEHRKEVIRMDHENLTKVQKRQEYYDKHRSKVIFKEADQVLLATHNLHLKHAQMLDESERPKLVPRFIGPFEIVKTNNDNAMRLMLPRSMSRVNDVFNVDRLKHYHPNEAKFASRPILKATPVVLDESTGEEMYIVEKLLKKRQFNRKLGCLVKWHGQPESEATWELMNDIKHVVHFKQLVQDLESRRFKV
ncbi:hypothetical protein AaE_011540, partial [Aphanomyces astaci]